GLSLGEYAAACVAGVFDFETGLKLVAERGRLMDKCCQEHPGGMAAVIGAEAAAIEAACQEAGVDVANYNCPGQIVISGEKSKLEKASAALAPVAKRVIPLTVAGAYHSRLMNAATEAFGKVLDGVAIAAPKCGFVQNVTGGFVSSPDEIRANLKAQVSSSVRWEQCARAMMGECDSILEFGPGSVLSGFVKRIDRSFPAEPAITE
ncbi:MAG: ACP S-malonyltransferase, partial [Victivallales bacterium]|nr:ACP S-malonyltransferase [Victivallales bacterium]